METFPASGPSRCTGPRTPVDSPYGKMDDFRQGVRNLIAGVAIFGVGISAAAGAVKVFLTEYQQEPQSALKINKK